MMKTIGCVGAVAIILAGAQGAQGAQIQCPELSGIYEASYVIMGERYDVVSTVTQKNCDSMQVQNQITSAHAVQSYTREWIADGVFRRKDKFDVVSATFTSETLVTTEVRSPLDPSVVYPRKYFSRRDFVFLDGNKNLINAEEQFDEQGNRIGTARFVYQRRVAP